MPFIADLMEIRVTDPAVENLDETSLASGSRRLKLKGARSSVAERVA
jgi:hypothetical protein